MTFKSIFKKTRISLVVLFFYFISNFLILNLINKSNFNEKKYICEKKAFVKYKFYNEQITNYTELLIDFLSTDKNIEKLDDVSLKITGDKIETCNEKISLIKNEIDNLLINFIDYSNASKNVMKEHNSDMTGALSQSYVSDLTITNLIKNNKKIIDLIIYDDTEYFIDNVFYTAAIIIIFNLFLTIFFFTIYVFLKNKKLFG